MNLFLYVSGNPINAVDPQGLHEWPYSHIHTKRDHPTLQADAETYPKLLGLLGKETRFYPHYDTRHPCVQEMIDLHEQYHHEVDLNDEEGAYRQELKNIDDKLKGLDPCDPCAKELEKLKAEIKKRLGMS